MALIAKRKSQRKRIAQARRVRQLRAFRQRAEARRSQGATDAGAPARGGGAANGATPDPKNAVASNCSAAGIASERSALVETNRRPQTAADRYQSSQGRRFEVKASDPSATQADIKDFVAQAMRVEARLDESNDRADVHETVPDIGESEPHSDKADSKRMLPFVRRAKRIDSNWLALSSQLKAKTGVAGARRHMRREESPSAPSSSETLVPGTQRGLRHDGVRGEPTRALAIDCEMVGAGYKGNVSILARVAVVNSRCEVVYHTYVLPTMTVTDYRTRWSGIRADDLDPENDDVVLFSEARTNVSRLLKGRILVGHALKFDLSALELSHPRTHVRDTSSSELVCRAMLQRDSAGRSLRRLSAELLGLEIQGGEHDPREDARAAMMIYQRFAAIWEAQTHHSQLPSKVTERTTLKSSLQNFDEKL